MIKKHFAASCKCKYIVPRGQQRLIPLEGGFKPFLGDYLVNLYRFFGAGSAVTENIEKGHDGKNPVIPRPQALCATFLTRCECAW